MWKARSAASCGNRTRGRTNDHLERITRAGQQLRLSGRGITRARGAAGHLHAMVRIEVPTVVDDRQKALYQELATISAFDPRAHFEQEAT